MDRRSAADLSDRYWYRTPGAIEHWFHGVFEGGGAKGVAYAGALLAMKEKKCWFKGVAGASAGAITAALVACGLSPEEIEDATDSALRQLHTGVWAGLRRLEKTGGYFPSSGLRVWLDDLLRAQVARSVGSTPSGKVTFGQLYAATGIDLNVVAADLSLRRQIIFSHNDTANSGVADAVVASSSIPFAFPSCLLQVPEDNQGKQLYHHTIVDGGVWSNFPLFVFEDSAFRRFYKRSDEIRPERVLGFVLKEADGEPPPRGDGVGFVEAVPVREFRAREWASGTESAVAEPVGLGSRVGAWALYPFSLLGRFAEWKSGVERGRWPTPRSKLTRNLVRSLDGLLGGIHPMLFGLLAWVVVAVGAWEVISYFGTDQIHVLRRTDWTDPMAYAVRPATVILTLSIVAVSVLVVFASLLAVAANLILLRASRRILYGLITTYVAGPGAPEWVAERRNVIALAIPPSVTTLSFEMRAEERHDLMASARHATTAKLTDLLSGEKHTG